MSETPSLWNDFVWPLYDRREDRSVMKVLKACGGYIKHSIKDLCIKRLVFSDHVTPSKLFKMMACCSKVTQLILPTRAKLDTEQLKVAVQHMEHLEKLEVYLIDEYVDPLLQIEGRPKELTVHIPPKSQILCFVLLTEWVQNNFMPHDLNIVALMFSCDLIF